jgi:glycosyltransferase involved in cell wall biosynthesis
MDGPRQGTDEPLRVLYVHHRSELGGAPTSLAYLIRELDRDRVEPHAFCPPGAAAELFASAGAIVHTGSVASFTHIWASVYRGRRWLLFFRELARLPSHLLQFRRTLSETQFDLVHINDSPMIPAAWLARRRGIPVVWHLRSALPYGGRDARSRRVRAFIRRNGAASIAINTDVRDVFDVGSVVVPNSVDLERFHPGDRVAAKLAVGLPPDRPVVSFFGFIYPSKGFREFIEMAGTLRARGYDASFLVVGGAVRGRDFFRTAVGRGLLVADLTRDYESEAERLVEELGLSDAVRFVPFTFDTSELYRASDVVVAPSLGPELGRPVIEAAASGVPVVATGSRTGGGIVKQGQTTVLVDENQVDGLAGAVAELLDNPDEREQMGSAARSHAEQTFDAHANGRRVEEMYGSIVHRGRVPILYVHHRPQLGGAPSSLAQLIANLDDRFEPHVYCPPGPAAELFAKAGAVVHTGVVSIFAHAWDSPYRGARWILLGRELAALIPHLRQFDRLMRTHRFPIVHLNDSPLIPAAFVARRRGARLVWHLRSALANDGRDRRARAIAGFMNRYGDHAIAIDEDVAARFPIDLPLTIVHNSVRLPVGERSEAAAAKALLGLPADRIAVGFAGFVRRQKGWQELVGAAERLVHEGAPVHVVVMGGGVRPPAFFNTLRGKTLTLAQLVVDEESAIKSLVAEKGLDAHFTFLPFTSHTAEVYAALDIVTFPNQGVGLGRPVLEAAMHGKPVVASGSQAGAGILLPDETGILLAEGTPDALVDALRRLIADRELRERLGQAAATHARRQFDPKQNAHAVEAVYDRLLGRAHRTPAADAGESTEIAAAR